MWGSVNHRQVSWLIFPLWLAPPRPPWATPGPPFAPSGHPGHPCPPGVVRLQTALSKWGGGWGLSPQNSTPIFTWPYVWPSPSLTATICDLANAMEDEAVFWVTGLVGRSQWRGHPLQSLTRNRPVQLEVKITKISTSPVNFSQWRVNLQHFQVNWSLQSWSQCVPSHESPAPCGGWVYRNYLASWWQNLGFVSPASVSDEKTWEWWSHDQEAGLHFGGKMNSSRIKKEWSARL